MRAFAIAAIDREPDDAFFETIAELSSAGVDFLLLRDKTLPAPRRWRAAERCRTLIRPPAVFLVHGWVDLARAVEADGVHLPSDGPPVEAVREVAGGLIVGRSCHSVAECARAADEGADYALLGPLFPPRSKPGERLVSREDLVEAAKLGVDIYALGGLSMENLHVLSGSGVAGVAAVSLFLADRPLDPIMEAIRRL
ncbi:MAG: thiamine phosphate synthase [Thermoanaerobaculia bacterium]